jgi:very-short-patch-repair endonuclease
MLLSSGDFHSSTPLAPISNRRGKAIMARLRAGRFAGFKFRRQHPLGKYYLDF